MSKPSHLQRTLLFSLTAALLIMLAACNSGQAGTGQVTPTAAPANLESTTQPTPSNTAQPTEPGKPGPAETGTPFAGKTVIPLPEGPLTVAYVKDDNLWIWTPDRGPVQITTGKTVFDLRLSDDGTLAAYVIMAGDLQYELWAINTDGSNDHKLVSSDELKAVVPEANSVALNQFEWVPGTHQVAYNTRVIVQAPGDFFNKDLYLVDADSLEKQVVFQPGSAGKFYFSPDGQQIALASPGLLSLVNADGSNLREALTFTVAGTTEEFPYYPIPVWAQDASRLAVAVPASDPRTTARQEATLWLIPLDGSAATKAGSFQTVFAPANRLFISPDLAHVLYTLDSSDPGSSQGEVHLARIDGSEDRIVAAQAYLMAYGWSSPETFLYGGGDPVDVVEGQVSGTTQVLAPGIGGLYDAHDAGNGDVLLMQGNGPIWTFSLAADGSIFPVDSGGGGTPAAFDIDW